MNTAIMKKTTPVWLTTVAILGLVWNAYGVYQFVGSLSQTSAKLMTAGMTAEQAELYLSLPIWITLVFAVGVFAGAAGSIALLLKKAVALPIFAVSLIGYLLLFAGDVYYGVFNSIPEQLAILGLVVAIAAVLLGVTRFAQVRSLIS